MKRYAKRASVVAVAVAAAFALLGGAWAGPHSALAAVISPAAPHLILFDSQGTQTAHVTTATSVGAFLKERGIVPGPRDYVHPAVDAPIFDNTVIEFSAEVPVRLVTKSGSRTIVTTAGDVGALLEEQGIQLGPHDVVHPSLSDPIEANATIRVTQILKWESTERHHIAQRTIHVIDFALPAGRSKVLRHGVVGLSETMVDYTQTDGKLAKRVLQTRMLRRPQTRVIAEGVGTYAALADFARRGLEKTSYIAAGALDMIATAYTADCAGCSGYTASGRRAGRGIVAVDPNLIPLGSKLYIPGYGFAIAGDTGGAIIGHRIDLGFDSTADAMQFGRRAVKVYTLQ